MSVQKLLNNLKDYNLRNDSGDLDQYDDVRELFFEIELIVYNNFLKTIEDLKSEEYLEEVKHYYLLDNNDNKISLLEFVPLISEGVDEWSMLGDNEYIDR